MTEIQHAFPVMTYDIDFAGVVSNLTYIRWLEDLRNLFAAQSLPLGVAMQRGIVPVLMRTEIDYLAPVRFPDTVAGQMWLSERGRARFVLAAEFIRQSDGMSVAKARQTGAFVALATQRPVRLPDEYTR
ncbi:MAG: acyl-CoA thioesterase [Anaerolineales bacterium]|nr:acyl-CoA thioesterase [Anaerolineales bacterium]